MERIKTKTINVSSSGPVPTEPKINSITATDIHEGGTTEVVLKINDEATGEDFKFSIKNLVKGNLLGMPSATQWQTTQNNSTETYTFGEVGIPDAEVSFSEGNYKVCAEIVSNGDKECTSFHVFPGSELGEPVKIPENKVIIVIIVFTGVMLVLSRKQKI